MKTQTFAPGKTAGTFVMTSVYEKVLTEKEFDRMKLRLQKQKEALDNFDVAKSKAEIDAQIATMAAAEK